MHTFSHLAHLRPNTCSIKSKHLQYFLRWFCNRNVFFAHSVCDGALQCAISIEFWFKCSYSIRIFVENVGNEKVTRRRQWRRRQLTRSTNSNWETATLSIGFVALHMIPCVLCGMWNLNVRLHFEKRKKIDPADATLTSAGVKVFNLMCDNLGILMARMSQKMPLLIKTWRFLARKSEIEVKKKSGRHTRKIANTHSENSFKISAGVSIHSLYNI